jgi:hypothetical protein
MSDEDARRWAKRESAELEKVPNSEEVRTPVNGHGAVFFPAQSTEAICQHIYDLGAKRIADTRDQHVSNDPTLYLIFGDYKHPR